jgi:hypothetical protein
MLVKSFTGQTFIDILNKVPKEYEELPFFVNWGYNKLNSYFVFMGVFNVNVKRIDNKGVVGAGVYGRYDDFVKEHAQTYTRPCLFFGETDAGCIDDTTVEMLKRQINLNSMHNKYVGLPICMIVSTTDYTHGSFLNNLNDWLPNIKLGLGLHDLNIRGEFTSNPNEVYYARNTYLVLEILNEGLTCGEIWSNNRDYSKDELIPIYSLDDPKYCTPYTDLSSWLSYHPQYKLVKNIEDAEIIFTSNVYVNDLSVVAAKKEIRQYDN